jgi:uncharacterized protein with PQ loop repeat
MFIGILLWLVYCIRIDSLSIILANVITATLVGTILVYIIKGKQ